MMRHIDGSLDADHLDHKNDLKKDIFRRKAQLNQVKKYNFINIRWKILLYDIYNVARHFFRWKIIYRKNRVDI